MQKQGASNQRPVIPRVRYHPSIQTAGSGASAKSMERSTAGSGGRSETKTGQKNQILSGADPAVRPATRDPCSAGDQDLSKPTQRSKTGAARHPPTRAEAKDRAPPTPDRVPLVLRADLDRALLQQVEVLTRGQSTNQNWFDWRKNRITASVAHRIAHSRFVNGKSKAPPSSYLAAITGEGPKVQTRAMSWGIQKEAEAVRRYQRLKTAALGLPVRVLDCGLFIDSERPWLAASPDGIVVDGRTGQKLLCLEVKCPYKHRNGTVEEACRDDGAFCLKLQDEDRRMPGEPPVYALKRSHCYFTQIQVQLAVTKLDRADLVVFTLKETAIVPVEFDHDLWGETVSKLEVFYRDAILPHIREQRARTIET